jgi:hypothetical protein
MRIRFLVLALLAVLLPAGAAFATDPPTVTISSTGTTFVAGSSTVATVSVRNGNNTDVAIYATLNGVTKQLGCGGVNVNDDDFHCSVFMYENTLVYVTFGDQNATHQAELRFWVRPLIVTQLKSGYTTSGRYAVMAHGTAPVFRSLSSPSRPGHMCLRHQVQRLRSGVWRTVVLTGCRTEDAKGRVTWKWAGTHPSRVSFRVRATFPGDALNVAGPGRWLYFRFR